MQAIYDAQPVSEVVRILSEAQQKTEDIYITSSEEEEPERTAYLNSFMLEK